MTTPDAVDEAWRLARQAVRLATDAHDPALSAGIDAMTRRWRDSTSTVVVAGEVKRGKSSLINAILRRPDLLPVDADVPTSRQVSIFRSPSPLLRVTRRSADEKITVAELPIRDLPDYATAAADPNLSRGVLSIEVGTESPALPEGVVLVDTPGLGSMTPGHRQEALAAAASADLLLFTIASDEPMLRTEVTFLGQVMQRVGSVIFVMSHVDVNPDWARLHQENRVRLGRSTVADAPVLPVSAKLELRSLDLPDPSGRLLSERSGLASVRAVIGRAAHRRNEHRALGLVSMIESGANGLIAGQQARLRADDPVGALADLDRELATLERELDREARWRRAQAAAIAHLQSGFSVELGRRLDALELEYQQQLSGTPSGRIPVLVEQLPDDLERSLGALIVQLAWWLEEHTTNELAELAEVIVAPGPGEFRLDQEVFDAVRQRSAGAATDASTLTERLIDDGTPLVSQSWIFGQLTAGVIGAAFGWWLILPIGAAVAGPLLLLRRRRQTLNRSRQEYQRVVRDTLSVARREMSAAANDQLGELKLDLEERISTVIVQRRGDLARRRRDLETRRARVREDTRRIRADVDRLCAAAHSVLADAADIRRRLERDLASDPASDLASDLERG